MASNYVILGLKSGATLQEIKSKFRSLSKQLHPDVNGGDKSKTDRFVIVLAAYEALLKGESGEKENFYNRGQKKPAEYRFVSIKKDTEFYLVRLHLDDVYKVEIHGKNYKKIGSYKTSHVIGEVNLTVAFEEAKKADYMFRITLYDVKGNSAEITYKVEPPKVSLFQKFKNLFK